MSTTNIEYLDYTWNVAPGCTLVSPGCVNCWAEMMAKRLEAMGQENYWGLTDDRGRWTGRVRELIGKLEDPFHLKKPRRIGVNYMGDLFHPNVSFGFQMQVFDTMFHANWHAYFILTKRPAGMFQFMRRSGIMAEKFPHVLVGTTVENQEWAGKRVMDMMDISEAGFRTWVSYEPALGPVCWGPWDFVEFLAAGGESGAKARLSHPDWFLSTRDWCLENNVKFFFKQWGEWCPAPLSPNGDIPPNRNPATSGGARITDLGGIVMAKIGKKKAGRVLDGRTWDEVP